MPLQTNSVCACKVIRNKKRFHHQALVEVKILEHLRDNDPDGQYNIINTLDYFYFRNHLCITFECLSLNLYEFIKNNNFQGLSLGLIRRATAPGTPHDLIFRIGRFLSTVPHI